MRSFAEEGYADQPSFYKQGFRLAIDAKYFLPAGKRNRLFLGLEGRVKRLDFSVYRPHLVYLDNYLVPYDEGGYLFQPARTEPRTLTSWGLTPVFGVNRMLGRRFMLECYAGIGVCYRDLNLHGAPSMINESPDPDRKTALFDLTPTEADLRAARWQTSISLGFRIAVLLNKLKH
ncbi:hypothetical protein DCC81_19620 [Chitinophaga parva]|uniref:Outer membrane protein beta-barrel domain-containing protein n=1 Tax=Chitinophaga parva TaxID=2169414 RepID=A0A2T7BC22_9BACT|nr:hypothetical protein [Chitinophaga parva]PUZ22644.1 hypothetical protein DCC81_19620 [Chitinophaga parva]